MFVIISKQCLLLLRAGKGQGGQRICALKEQKHIRFVSISRWCLLQLCAYACMGVGGGMLS